MANVTGSAPVPWDALAQHFLSFHQNPNNVAIHLFTAPLGILGFLSILSLPIQSAKPIAYRSFLLGLTALYWLSLAIQLPLALWLLSGVILLGIALSALHLRLGMVMAIALLVLGYVGQDVAHAVCGEGTFQDTYKDKPLLLWVFALAEQSYYLLPLILHSAVSISLIYLFLPSLCLLLVLAISDGWFPWQLRRSKFMRTKFTSQASLDDIGAIRSWAIGKHPSNKNSTHWWVTDLDPAPRQAFDRIASSDTIRDMFLKYHGSEPIGIDILNGMNEVYVTGPSRQLTSDTVFYTKHIDGPYVIWPFASVHRVLVAMDLNTEITTLFPMVPTQLTAQTGDVFGFDFNREIHYIEADHSRPNKEFRLVLKLHFCVYNRNFAFMGKLLGDLTTRYDVFARGVFLTTLRPKTLYQRITARWVIINTICYNAMEEYFGWANFFYLLLLTVLTVAQGNWLIFLYGTSFVHYYKYITTFYHRGDVSFGLFKRDVLLFKGLTLAQIFAVYTYGLAQHAWQVNWFSVGLVCLGYGVSLSATKALGVDRTYFGVELGVCPPKRVTVFPYNLGIPHPMLLSQIVALLGVHLFDPFRAILPYYIPIHIALYLVHMIQEQFDIHTRNLTSIIKPHQT